MSDNYLLKEYKKAKDRKASKQYLKYIYALSLIDGSHKEHLKAQREAIKFFEHLHFTEEYMSEEKMVKIIAGKWWARGFNHAIKNLDKLKGVEEE